MEVETAQVASDVDDFANEVEAGDVAGFQGAGLQVGGVDAAGGYFGFGEAFCAGGVDGPVVQILLAGFERGVGPADGGCDLAYMLGQTLG